MSDQNRFGRWLTDRDLSARMLPDRARVVLAVLVLAGALAVSLSQVQSPFRGVSSDFIARYAAGQAVDDGVSPYARRGLRPYQAAFDDPTPVPVFDAPPVLGAFRMLTLLPLKAATTILTILSLLGVGVIAWVVTGRERPRGEAGGGAGPFVVWGLCWAALLQATPIRHCLALGQTDVVSLAAVLLLGAWVPALALAKPQVVGLTAAAIFGRAVGLRWPPAVPAIRWRTVLIGLGSSIVLVAFAQVCASAARWDDWLERMGDRQGAFGRHWLVPVVSALGIVVIVRGIRRARRAGHRIDGVCLAAGATSLLAVSGGWNPQWFVALVIPLGAILVPHLLGRLGLDRLQAGVLILVCAASAGDAFASYTAVNSSYRWEVPAVALVGLLGTFWLLQLISAGTGALVLALNTLIVQIPLSAEERIAVSVATAVGVLYLLLELRPSGLLKPVPLVERDAALG